MQMPRRSDQMIRDLMLAIRTQAIGMWRYRWVAIAVTWCACVAGWVAVYTLPDIYSANARVFVDTENAIEDFLGDIASPTDVMSEVAVVVREIVSRPNLAEVARNTDLALRALTDEEFEALLTSLQDKIDVSGNREGVYSISFEDPDREKALAVVDALLTAFVEKSLGADRSDSVQAQRFLQDQIDEYAERLTLAEDRLAEFKRANVTLMPDQRGDYFERLQAAEAALLVTDSQLNLAVERRAELQRQIEGEAPVFGIVTGTGESDGGGFSSAKIQELELQLAELRLQYTDKHPRIGQLLDTIEMLREQEAENRAAQREAGRQSLAQQNPLDLNPVYQNMRIQLSNVEVEIAALRAERGQQQAEVSRLRQSVDQIPQIEAELNRLNRDYDVIKAKHQQLVQQLEIANIGEDVSRSIDGVQFRIIDPPFSPTEPVGPIRPLFLSVVLVFALGVSLGIAFLLNQLNPTFIGSRSVTEALGIPVLASVSLLQSDDQMKRDRRGRRLLHASFATLLVSFVLVVSYSSPGSLALRQLLETVS